MSAPRSVEFDQNVLLGIKNNFVKVGGNEDLDGVLIPILWNFLAQQVLL
jgi:hypothetical protein